MANKELVGENKAKTRQKLGKVLENARIKKGFSQEALAKKVGIQVACLSQIETGKKSPSFDLLTKLASALDAKAFQFMRKAGVLDAGDKGKLLFSLVRFLEQAPDPDEIINSIRKLTAIEKRNRRINRC